MAKTRTIKLRFGSFNAPESFKRGLLRDKVERARRVFAVFTRQRIDVAALQEAGTFAEIVDAQFRGVKALWAKFNDFVKGRQIGNGVLVNGWRWKSRLLADVTVGEGDDEINIAVVSVVERRRRVPLKFKFYAVHRPTRRAANASLRPLIDIALREHTDLDDQLGVPWVIAGDMNVNPWGWGNDLGSHGVDHIRASKHFKPIAHHTIDRPNLSDHDFLVADAEYVQKLS